MSSDRSSPPSSFHSIAAEASGEKHTLWNQPWLWTKTGTMPCGHAVFVRFHTTMVSIHSIDAWKAKIKHVYIAWPRSLTKSQFSAQTLEWPDSSPGQRGSTSISALILWQYPCFHATGAWGEQEKGTMCWEEGEATLKQFIRNSALYSCVDPSISPAVWSTQTDLNK